MTFTTKVSFSTFEVPGEIHYVLKGQFVDSG